MEWMSSITAQRQKIAKQCFHPFKMILIPFNLNRHMKYCGEERNLSCNYCGHKFIREQNLNHHIKINHTHELSKVHCEYCQKDYATVNSYRQHFEKGNCKTLKWRRTLAVVKAAAATAVVKAVIGKGRENRDEDIQVASGVVYK